MDTEVTHIEVKVKDHTADFMCHPDEVKYSFGPDEIFTLTFRPKFQKGDDLVKMAYGVGLVSINVVGNLFVDQVCICDVRKDVGVVTIRGRGRAT